MSDDKKFLNDAEKFLIKTMNKRHPEIPRSTLFKWAMNHNLEIENEKLFHADDYEKMIDRAMAMYPDMPEAELQMISLMMCNHRSKLIEKGGHSEDRKEEITELTKLVTDPELAKISVMDFWGG